jgi:hypothetical protein
MPKTLQEKRERLKVMNLFYVKVFKNLDVKGFVSYMPKKACALSSHSKNCSHVGEAEILQHGG